MSDCSTEAMKPKERPEVYGFPDTKILRLLEPQGEPDVIECDGVRYIPERTCTKAHFNPPFHGGGYPASRMVCSACGDRIGVYANYCKHCGAKVVVE